MDSRNDVGNDLVDQSILICESDSKHNDINNLRYKDQDDLRYKNNLNHNDLRYGIADLRHNNKNNKGVHPSLGLHLLV